MRSFFVLLVLAAWPLAGFASSKELQMAKQSRDSLVQEQRDISKKEQAIRQKLQSVQRVLQEQEQAYAGLAQELSALASQVQQAEDAHALKQTKLAQAIAKQETVLQNLQRLEHRRKSGLLWQMQNAKQTARTSLLLTGVFATLRQETLQLQTLVLAAQTAATKSAHLQHTLSEKQAKAKKRQSELEGLLHKQQVALNALLDLKRVKGKNLSAANQKIQALEELVQALVPPTLPERQAAFGVPVPQERPLTLARSSTNSGETRSRKVIPVRAVPVRKSTKLPKNGTWQVPSAGKIIARFGRSNSVGLSTKGTTILTAAGARVVAPQSGRVVYADSLRTYGRVVIVQHKGGLHSVLAGLSKIKTRPGRTVKAGETIGIMGNSTKSRRLYLELRKKGIAINPTRLVQMAGAR